MFFEVSKLWQILNYFLFYIVQYKSQVRYARQKKPHVWISSTVDIAAKKTATGFLNCLFENYCSLDVLKDASLLHQNLTRQNFQKIVKLHDEQNFSEFALRL